MTLFDAPHNPAPGGPRTFRAVVVDHRTVSLEFEVDAGEDVEQAAEDMARLYLAEGGEDARSTQVVLLEECLPFPTVLTPAPPASS
jgi:hypothetical protein